MGANADREERSKIEMRRITSAVIALIFVLGMAGLGFAADKSFIKGSVTKMDDKTITVKDDAGQEMTVEGNTNGIKIGDKVIVVVDNPPAPKAKVRDKLTAEEISFLTSQCGIDQADVDIIPQLTERGREILFQRIEKRDCKLLVAFKASRNYYRQLRYDKPLPLPPAGWNGNYLTEKEFERYGDILLKAPW
jgi:hypothetical protein